jgi:hypothetical protein
METLIASPALQCAIELYLQPVKARKFERNPLPHGVFELLQIAAQGEEKADEFSQIAGLSAPDLYRAVTFYLQAVVFHQAASDQRLLALTDGFDAETLRNHKRMILKWLHPDRNHNRWESKLFLRVQSAAKRLEQTFKDGGLLDNGIPKAEKQTRRRHEHSPRLSPRPHNASNITLFFKNAILPLMISLAVCLIGLFVTYSLMNDGRVFSAFGGEP